MFINQMQRLNTLSEIENFGKVSSQPSPAQNGEAIFRDVLESAVKNIVETDNEVNKQQYLLATGQTDDVHNLTIAATKAQLSVDYMVQLRNRAMESYSEIMRINF